MKFSQRGMTTKEAALRCLMIELYGLWVRYPDIDEVLDCRTTANQHDRIVKFRAAEIGKIMDRLEAMIKRRDPDFDRIEWVAGNEHQETA